MGVGELVGESVGVAVAVPVREAESVELAVPKGVCAALGVPVTVIVAEGELESVMQVGDALRVAEALGVGRALGVTENTHSGLATARTLTITPAPTTLKLVLKVRVREAPEEVPLTGTAARLGLPEKV